MQIPLDQFEQYIDETILRRGLSYFKNGQVNPPEEITPGQYEVIVEGSEDYIIQLKIQSGNIQEFSCSCPYDLGPVCKHVAAVIFHLQQEELKLQASPKKKRANEKSPKSKPLAEKINEILEKVSHDELKQFICEKSKDNPSFRNIFLSSFAHQSTGESKEFYGKQIKSILKAAAGRDGFIDWTGIRHAGKQVYDLLVTAQKLYESKNYRSAVFICCAVMEEMTEALQFADDSNGDIGGPIEEAYRLLYDITSKELLENTRVYLLEYCLQAFNKNVFSGWDWHVGILRIASQVLKSDEDIEKLIALLDKPMRSEWEMEEAQEIKFLILEKFKGQEEAERYTEQNISNPSLRKNAIEKALFKKDFEKAISIARDGIKENAKDKPGLVMEWYDWLLKIAITQSEKKKIIEYARLLFVDSIHEKEEYYRLMKNNVEPEKWHGFVEDLIKDIKRKDRWLDFNLIACIYINEEWWSRLLEHIRQKPSLNVIQHYEPYLSKDYANELVELYALCIVELMKTSTGRNHYQNACRYLRRMIKLGAREKASKLIAFFREQYPQRKALMEELDYV